MDQAKKLATLTAAVVAAGCAFGFITSLDKFRDGMEFSDPRLTKQGVTGMILNGAIIAALVGMLAFVHLKMDEIVF